MRKTSAVLIFMPGQPACQPARAPNLRANFCQRLITGQRSEVRGHPPSHKASIFATSSAEATARQESYDVTGRAEVSIHHQSKCIRNSAIRLAILRPTVG